MEYKYQSRATKNDEYTVRAKAAEVDRVHPERMWPMLENRMDETVEVFHEWDFSPHLKVGEIGAERCQRILALIHKYKFTGYAFDISPDALKTSSMIIDKYFGEQDRQKLKLCPGDIMESEEENFDFIFGFAVIHHFPDPRPVMMKIYKMLKPGGFYYLDREAIASKLGLNKLRSMVLSRGGAPTVGNILENWFPLDLWKEAFDVFDDYNIKISFPPFKKKYKLRRWHEIPGGRLSGYLWRSI